jgi:formylglycine-generating enzyme required for sulfatase activity
MAWYGNNSGRQYLNAAEIWRTQGGERKDYYGQLEDNQNQTHPVGTKTPNAFGLYDMLGNVFEWCQDAYDNYPGTPRGKSVRTSETQNDRVHRGGAWSSDASSLRSADRHSITPDFSNFNFGVRLVAIRSASNDN